MLDWNQGLIKVYHVALVWKRPVMFCKWRVKNVCRLKLPLNMVALASISTREWLFECTKLPYYAIFYNSCTHCRTGFIINIISGQTVHPKMTVTWVWWIVIVMPQRCMSTHSTNACRGPQKKEEILQICVETHRRSLLTPRATSFAAVSSPSLTSKLTPNVSSSGRPTSPSDGVEGTATQKRKNRHQWRGMRTVQSP